MNNKLMQYKILNKKLQLFKTIIIYASYNSLRVSIANFQFGVFINTIVMKRIV